MVACCGPKIAKLFLFIFNFCIWLCGLVLIGGGAYVTAKHIDYQDLFADDTILTVSLTVSLTAVGVGLFIFVVGFSGCCGALKESSCLLTLLCGLVLIGRGAYETAKHIDYHYLFADDMILTVSWTAIGLGLFIFVVGFSGCCGALNESSCLLKLYFIFLLLIVLAEGFLGIRTFISSGDIEDNMTKGMQKAINETYDVKGGSTAVVDDVQQTFKCCGASGYRDYKTSQHLQGAVPQSCCRPNEECTGGSKGNPFYPNRVWTDGCVHATTDTIENHYLAIGGAAFGLFIFEILTMVFACCVIKGIDKGYEKVA